jgi:hypothetical protein
MSIEAGMARLLARQIARGLSLPKSAVADSFRAFLESAATVLIGAVRFDKPISELMPFLRHAVYSVVEASSADLVVQYLAPRLDEWLPIFRVNWTTNKLLREVREVARANPGAVRTAVKDSACMLRLAFRMLGEVPEPEIKSTTPTNRYMMGRLIGPLPAVLAAVSLCDGNDPRYRRFYSRLRSGADFGLGPKKVAQFYEDSVAQLRAVQNGAETIAVPRREIELPIRS